MISREDIRSAIFCAINRVRDLQYDETILAPDETVVILGTEAALDSMGFVNFVVAVEEEISRISDTHLDLAEHLAFTDESSPRTVRVADVIDLIYRLIRA